MPRIGRIVLPGNPHHIIQRGHNRQVVFAETRDLINLRVGPLKLREVGS